MFPVHTPVMIVTKAHPTLEIIGVITESRPTQYTIIPMYQVSYPTKHEIEVKGYMVSAKNPLIKISQDDILCVDEVDPEFSRRFGLIYKY